MSHSSAASLKQRKVSPEVRLRSAVENSTASRSLPSAPTLQLANCWSRKTKRSRRRTDARPPAGVPPPAGGFRFTHQSIAPRRVSGTRQSTMVCHSCFPTASWSVGKAGPYRGHAAERVAKSDCFAVRLRSVLQQYGSAGETKRRLAAQLILRFILPRITEGPYAEQRTSYVLFNRASSRMPGKTTRLPGGVAPVDPHQRGASPSSGLSPIRRGVEGSNER
jgi:hypothetical protein